MWPMLLDMPKIECKKALRSMELDTYSSVVSTFRAQGDLNCRKLQVLNELQSLLRISIDRHKAELRRAANDEKLYTMAKKLSHGECVSKEWIKQSKRLVPLLPNFLHQNSKAAYYRILADHILKKANPILQLYPEPFETAAPVIGGVVDEAVPSAAAATADDSLVKLSSDLNELTKSSAVNGGIEETSKVKNGRLLKKKRRKLERLRLAEQNQNLLELESGYLAKSSSVIAEKQEPSEFLNQFHDDDDSENLPTDAAAANEEPEEDEHLFLRSLISKFKQQQLDRQRLEQEAKKPLEQKEQKEQVKDEEEPVARSSKKTSNPIVFKTDRVEPVSTLDVGYIEPPVVHFTNGPPKPTISSKLPSTIKLAPPTHSILRLSPSSHSPTGATAQAHLIQKTNCLTPSVPSTIVKLNSQPQMSFKTSTSPTPPTYSVVSFPSSPSTTSSPNLPLKQIMLPKPTQKLFFLPTASQASSPAPVMAPTTRPNVAAYVPATAAVPQTTTLSLLPAQQQQPTKLIVYKAAPTTTTIGSTTSFNDKSPSSSVIVNGNPGASKLTKSLKILTTTPASSPPVISLSATNPTTLLNKQIIRSLTPQAAGSSPTTLVAMTSPKPPQQSAMSLTQAFNRGLEVLASVSTSDLSQSSTSPSINNTTMTSPISPSSSSSLLNGSSPPNWCETNLKFIKEMLNKLNSSDQKSADAKEEQSEETAAADGGAVQQSAEGVKVLCESVKEKLERNAYECMDDLNNDIQLIRQKLSASSSLTEYANSIVDNAAAGETLKQHSKTIALGSENFNKHHHESALDESLNDYDKSSNIKRIKLID